MAYIKKFDPFEIGKENVLSEEEYKKVRDYADKRSKLNIDKKRAFDKEESIKEKRKIQETDFKSSLRKRYYIKDEIW